MGLDVVAYSEIGSFFSDKIDVYAGKMIDDGSANFLYIHEDFKSQALPLTKTGVYLKSPAAREFRFWAGSYASYNHWRNNLARVAGYPDSGGERWDRSCWDASSGPFKELIDFSDCEGVIGQQASVKLLGDFQSHAHVAAREDSNFVRVYTDFMSAFATAAVGGVVSFR